MEEQNENVNTLFNTINYREPHELNKFIDDMNVDQALILFSSCNSSRTQ